MGRFEVRDRVFRWSQAGELVELTSPAPGALRVRATRNHVFAAVPNALVSEKPGRLDTDMSDTLATVRSGGLEARITAYGRLRFYPVGAPEPLLEEEDWNPEFTQLRPLGREYGPPRGDLGRIEQRFAAFPGERCYGLGQHRHGLLDQKGAVIELLQRNAEVAIPFLVSSRRYGLLWNHPGTGRVELGTNRTRWVADAARQIDYVVMTGDRYADILSTYADLTGHAPVLPDWAAGFWQSKLRYLTQDELMGVAREYRRRSLPLSVIVVDFFHWTKQGEWAWDRTHWPDPAGMIRELAGMGIRVAVSVWPSVNPNASTAREMRERDYLVRTDHGANVLLPFVDNGDSGMVYLHYYDPFNPEARAWLWKRLKESYIDAGASVLWLDACEPEMRPLQHANLRFAAGSGEEIACLYPFMHQMGVHDGLVAAGREPVSLCRSAWAGSQRFGAIVWSGDIESSWEVLRGQVKAGLNMNLSGIPWWSSDIGGFTGGRVDDPAFHELLVRSFQWSVFCPIFRLHGYREPSQPGTGSGAANEIWSFGEATCLILKAQLDLREKLRPYLMEQMRAAAAHGAPPMRPLFFDYPDEETCWRVEDELMLGPDVLVAPVLEAGARKRVVWLPGGAVWRDAWTGADAPSGTVFEAEAPLERIPVYLRREAKVSLRG